MPKKKRVGVVAPGTPPAVRERYEAMKRDPEARKYAEEKGRYGPKGTLAAIAWAAAKGKKKKKGVGAKSLETPTAKEREKQEAAEKSFAVGENVFWYPFREMITGDVIGKAVVTEKLYKDSKFVKRTVDDEALMACLRQKVRSRYRSNKQYNPEKANAKSIYDDILADSVYDQYIEAAIVLMRKKKTPFSVAYIQKLMKETDVSAATEVKESSGDAPMPVGY